jgi:hypothetical protein
MFITWPSQKVGESSGSLGNRGEGKKGTVGLVERLGRLELMLCFLLHFFLCVGKYRAI